jgi:hypothetical protein
MAKDTGSPKSSLTPAWRSVIDGNDTPVRKDRRIANLFYLDHAGMVVTIIYDPNGKLMNDADR